MKEIFVFGHKKPDTDSVAAAVALSHLKNQLGWKATPKILDPINNETKFVLDYFGVEEPEYLNDVKLKIKDLDYQRQYYLKEEESILSSYMYMTENKMSSIPVIDENQSFIGMVSIKDITKYQILNQKNNLYTSYTNILFALKGKEILKFNDIIQGDILFSSLEDVDANKLSIIITNGVGNISKALEDGIKLIVLANEFELNKTEIEQAKENNINIIATSLSIFEVANLIGLSNYVSEITTNNKLVYFNEDTYVSDFIEIANNTKYSNYPIIDENNKCLGTLKLTDLSKKNPKQVILVDHNEYEQSADGLEESEIIEIVDHHKIGGVGTKEPISFRNMPVGSSNTILYLMYQENDIEIPKHIAGLMISGILSDTLLLTSPTTTPTDKKVVSELEKIADIQYYEYGIKMFEAGSSLVGKTKEEILYTDFKNFTISESKVGIGQIFTMSISDLKNEVAEYESLLNDISQKNGYALVALFITDVINNGSYVVFNDKAKKIMGNSFNVENMEQFTYIPDCVSRKKQIIPNIMRAMEK